MWAIMGVAVNPRGERAWAGWVIGIALGAGVLVFAPLDGAGLQPRALVRARDRRRGEYADGGSTSSAP